MKRTATSKATRDNRNAAKSGRGSILHPPSPLDGETRLYLVYRKDGANVRIHANHCGYLFPDVLVFVDTDGRVVAGFYSPLSFAEMKVMAGKAEAVEQEGAA